MKPTLLLAIAALIPNLASAASRAPKAPTTLTAQCVAFTWSDHGEPGEIVPTLFYGTKEFKIGERVELFRTAHAIYQTVVSPNRPEEVFLDVLHLDGTRIAGAATQMVIGPDVAEPGRHTHFECYSEAALEKAKKEAGKPASK